MFSFIFQAIFFKFSENDPFIITKKKHFVGIFLILKNKILLKKFKQVLFFQIKGIFTQNFYKTYLTFFCYCIKTRL